MEAIEQLDRLREYRNYYVHGLQAVGWSADDRPIGLLLTVSARGELLQNDEWVDEAALDDLISRLDHLRLVPGRAMLARGGETDPLTGAVHALPSLQDRIPRLAKPKRRLIDPASD